MVISSLTITALEMWVSNETTYVKFPHKAYL